MNLKDRAKQLKSDIPTIYLCLKDKDCPFLAKVFGLLTIFYALSPIDLIPDFIPVLGYLDDLIILPLLVSLTIYFIPKELIVAKRVESNNIWVNGKPKKWYYGIPIVLIWFFIIKYVVGLFVS